jgi:hypothetical protein
MPVYSCIICNFETVNKKNYEIHILTEKHKNNLNETFQCVQCEYITKKEVNYKRHLLTKKHLKLNPIHRNENNLLENLIVQVKDEVKDEVREVKDEVNRQQEEARETIRLLLNKIEILEKKNDQNTNKIVKEARNIKSSVLTILNTNFKDTPSIEYIKEKPFIVELEKEYKAKVDDGSDKIFLRIFQDYEKKKLIKTLSDLILKFVKRDNQTFQSVFNIDSARSNFATKIDDFWLNDKKGIQLRKFTVDKVIGYMIEVLEIFRLQLVKIREQNIKNPTRSSCDYLMENQTLLLEVVSFLTNSNTHSKIITQLSPNLRCDEQLLILK